MRISPSLAGQIAETAASAVQAVASRPNQLSPTAVEGAKTEIKQEVKDALVQGTGDGTVAVVEVKSAFLSKINWTQAVAVLAMFGTMFGFDLTPELQAQIVAAIVGVTALVTWVLKTFFSNTVTASAVK